jgi:hypothetical protein
MVHDDRVYANWIEAERMPDPASPMGWSGPPLWSVVRVARLDDSGAIEGMARSVIPSGGARFVSAYWADLGSGQVGLGWYEGETDFAACPRCFAVGTNHFVLLAADLQSADSDVADLSWQTPDGGFVATAAARAGDEILVVGDMAHNLWQEAASATLRCAK